MYLLLLSFLCVCFFVYCDYCYQLELIVYQLYLYLYFFTTASGYPHPALGAATITKIICIGFSVDL